MQIIRRASFVTTPWKNGGGLTHEAIRFPATGEAFRWRLSVAQIDSSGPFSDFAGYHRKMVLLRGKGVILTFGAAGPAVGAGNAAGSHAQRMDAAVGDVAGLHAQRMDAAVGDAAGSHAQRMDAAVGDVARSHAQRMDTAVGDLAGSNSQRRGAAAPVRLVQVGDMAEFDGALETECRLIEGSCEDLNLMVSTSIPSVKAGVERLSRPRRLEAPPSGTALVFPISGALSLECAAADPVQLEPWDLAVMPAGGGVRPVVDHEPWPLVFFAALDDNSR